MASKILATKTFTDTSVNNEGTTRATNDSTISSELSTRNTEVSTSNVSITTLGNAVVAETNARSAIVGIGYDYSSLKLVDNTTSVSNMSQAIASLYRKQVSINAAAQGASSNESTTLLANATNQAAITTDNKNAIDAILLDAHANFDTFIELYNLTQGNRTNVLASTTSLQNSFTTTANSKVNKNQSEASTLVYLDQTNLTTTYSLVVDNGVLSIVEV